MDVWTIVATVISVLIVRWFIEKTGFTKKVATMLRSWFFGNIIAEMINSSTTKVDQEPVSETPNQGKEEIEEPKLITQIIETKTNGSIIVRPKNMEALEIHDRTKLIAMVVVERMLDAALPIIFCFIQTTPNKKRSK